MLVYHLRNGITQQHYVLVKRFDLPLQLDTVHQIDGDRYVLPPQSVEKGILQELAFIAHDILRVQNVVINQHLTTGKDMPRGSLSHIPAPHEALLSPVVLFRKRVVGSLHFNTQGGSHQIELLAEAPLQEPFVGIGHMLKRVAMDDDHGRVHTSLMGITHLGTEHTRPLGALKLHCLQKQSRQYGR